MPYVTIAERLKRLMDRCRQEPREQTKRVHGDNRRVKLRPRKVTSMQDDRFVIDETGCLSRVVGDVDEKPTEEGRG